MFRSAPSALHRAALRTVAAGVTAAILGVASAGHGPVLQPGLAHRQVAIPFVLAGVTTAQSTAGIVQSPTTLGVADSNLYALSDAEINKTLTKLADLGVRDIRVGVPWIYIEKRNDQFDWTKMDYVVQTANAKGINVVGVVTATPTWAGFPLNGHSDPAEYGEFAGLVAERYDGVDDNDEGQTYGKISAYEIWNEPNGALFYNPVSASAYTGMLKAASPAIRAADPDAVVIAGVLGPVVTIPGLSQNPVSFVRQMYQNGAADYFDALSYHAYHYTLPFSQGLRQANSPLNQVNALRALMAEFEGEGTTKKIWITEYGLPTNPQISEARQAAFIRDFVVAWQGIQNAGPIFIYSTRDSNSGGFDDEENFGIFYTNWAEKDAVDILRRLYGDLADGVLDDDFQAAIPNVSVLDQLLMLGRQIANLLLIVPRAVVQLAVSAVTGVAHAVINGVGSVLGLNAAPAASEDLGGGDAVSARWRAQDNESTDIREPVEAPKQVLPQNPDSDPGAQEVDTNTVDAADTKSVDTDAVDTDAVDTEGDAPIADPQPLAALRKKLRERLLPRTGADKEVVRHHETASDRDLDQVDSDPELGAEPPAAESTAGAPESSEPAA